MLKQSNSRKQGDVGLGAAIATFTAKGWTVCVPLTDNQPYDLIVDRGLGPERVQVKTSRYQTEYGVYQAALRTNGGNRSGTGKTKHFVPEEVEWLFVLTDAAETYLIPSSEVNARAALNLGDKMLPYKLGV